MLTLYYSPGACSQAPHILMHEIGLSHDAARVDLRSHTLEDGSSFYQVNPKGAVPVLELDNGETLTENAVVLQYLGDRATSDVLPPVGDFRRYRVLEMVNFITTELHKTFSPLFNPAINDEAKAVFRANLHRRLSHIDSTLAHRPYLAGEAFTVADAYLFVMIGWEPYVKVDPAPYPHLSAFHERVAARPSFARVLQAIEPVLGRMSLPIFPRTAGDGMPGARRA